MCNSDTNTPQYFKEATSTITTYANEKKTDYAILLNGDWGCGKTWFIDNILKDALEQDTKKKLLYISAAGIKDTTEFINDIYFARISKEIGDKHELAMIKTLSKYITDVGAIIHEKINSPKINNFIAKISTDIGKKKPVFSNTFIVIDDLERISETIKIEDFLYTIYDTFISQNVKILFVSNENAINKKNNESKYTDIKEKVIRHTIALHALESKSFEKIIDSIAQEKLTDTKYIKNYFIDKAFFMEHINDIKNLFNQREHLNLRTYLTYLDLAEKILSNETLIEKKLKKHKDILLILLNTLCFALIELNSDNQKSFHDHFCNDEYKLKKFKTYPIDYGNTPEKEYSEEEKRYHKYVKDIEKISAIDLNLYIFSDISDNPINIFVKYIKTGYLATEGIIEYYEYILRPDEEYEAAYDTLKNANLGDRKDVENAIGIVISKIEEDPDVFNLKNLVHIFINLKNVVYIISDEQKDIFKDIEHIIKDRIVKSKKFDNSNLDMSSFNLDFSSKDYELYDSIQEMIDEANKNVEKDLKKELLAEINKSDRLKQLVYSIKAQYTDMIFEPEFLEKITVRPFAITLFGLLIDNKIQNNHKMKFLGDLENYINGPDNTSYDTHLKKQIDLLNKKIETAKEIDEENTVIE